MPSWLTDKVLPLLLSGKDFYNSSNQCVVLVYILLTFRFYLKTTPQLITVKQQCNSYLVFSRFTKNEKNNKPKKQIQVRTLTVVAFLLFSTAYSESLPEAEIQVGAQHNLNQKIT